MSVIEDGGLFWAFAPIAVVSKFIDLYHTRVKDEEKNERNRSHAIMTFSQLLLTFFVNSVSPRFQGSDTSQSFTLPLSVNSRAFMPFNLPQ